MASWVDRVGDFFALDDDWVRPGGGIGRSDVVLTIVSVVVSLFVLELMRSVGSLSQVDEPVWQQVLLTAVPCLFLLPRRRWPLTTAALASAGYLAIGIYVPLMTSLLSTQIVFFLVVLAGVAWARNRRAMVAVYAMIVAAMFLWLVWSFAVGRALSDMAPDPDPGALFSVTVAAALMASIINILYFGGAVIGGQVAWRGARQRADLEQQTATIRDQAEALRDNAIIEERLRIARELHDVVAHHISGIGVQAAAARRVLDTDPEAAKGALGRIESGSRDAVGQMRGLLGTLRKGETPPGSDGGAEADGWVGADGSDHAPQPGLADIPELAESRASTSLTVVHELVEESTGDLEGVPDSIGHCLYRTAQEALTNVTRHSSARTARVAVRVDAASAEIEVTDDGRPRPGTSGTGMGQLGIRERINSHHGSVEMGPRPLGGYRVRARIPLRSGGDS
ncbi:sensor histidine kinase [Janibacter cremeus]|uniref:histidine kinase n=1 Tax=Janibacter cremeus TaxID=1285192 RepID=A0A852VNJ3_9MICO|nr:sensor histidine kinase [Janibacter cremeus]NYF98572.1 signal transduction histidine kinase [Janibacter cremeus]